MQLSMQSVMLRNADFEEVEDGSLEIESGIWVKLVDFSSAEMFKGQSFLCCESGVRNQPDTMAAIFDARAADMWSFGCIVFECLTKQSLFAVAVSEDASSTAAAHESAYEAWTQKALKAYLSEVDLLGVFTHFSYSLLRGLLAADEKDRLSSFGVIHHQYFRAYLKKYATEMEKEMDVDVKNVTAQRKEMKHFPFYCLE